MKMGDFAGGIGNEELLNAMISRWVIIYIYIYKRISILY